MRILCALMLLFGGCGRDSKKLPCTIEHLTQNEQDELAKDLKRDEGYRSKPYKDTTGHLTIGYGRNLEKGLTKKTAEYLLCEDIQEAVDETIILFGEKRFSSWESHQKVAVVNMMFNLGRPKLSKFHSTIKAIKRGDWNKAAEHARNSLWAEQVKGRAIRVTNKMRGIG